MRLRIPGALFSRPFCAALRFRVIAARRMHKVGHPPQPHGSKVRSHGPLFSGARLGIPARGAIESFLLARTRVSYDPRGISVRIYTRNAFNRLFEFYRFPREFLRFRGLHACIYEFGLALIDPS